MTNIRETVFGENSNRGNIICEEEKNVQSFAKQMLQSRMFIGNFQEKRYVQSLQAYRNVISIAKEETELIHDLEVVRKRIYAYYQNNHWIGITGPETVGAPVGHCIWVELPDEIFGSYWYKISKVKFRSNETILRLKVIRPVTTTSSDLYTTTNSSSNNMLEQSANTESSDTSVDPLTLQNLCYSFVAAKDILLNNTSSFLSSVITVQNTTEALKFISILLATVITGLIQLLQHFCDFIIKFMRESSNFIKSTTPIIMAVINLIGKIIGGFYLLILTMWRERKGPAPIYQSPYVVRNDRMLRGDGYGYNTVYFKRALPSVPRKQHRSGVRITPLD